MVLSEEERKLRVKESRKRYRLKNLDKTKEYNKQYYMKTRTLKPKELLSEEERKKRAAESKRRYKERNAEKIREYRREYNRKIRAA